jgi:RNA polymerase sigma-70 factor, ECF subfamily
VVVRPSLKRVVGYDGATLDAVQGSGEAAGVTVGLPSLRFEELYHAQVTTTLAVVLALRGPGSDAEDVVQEAFARALVRWAEVSAMARPDLWVQRVALNLATSRLRRRGAEARAVARLASRQRTAVTGAFGMEHRFWDAVRLLPPKQARVVALRYAGDLAVADIATIVGSAEGTVKAQLHTARKRLAVLLTEPNQETGS